MELYVHNRFEFHEAENEDEEPSCIDVDECNTEADRCDENAICYNEPGGYKCTCKPGYQGDGFNCLSKSSSIDNIVHVITSTSETLFFTAWTNSVNGYWASTSLLCLSILPIEITWIDYVMIN